MKEKRKEKKKLYRLTYIAGVREGESEKMFAEE